MVLTNFSLEKISSSPPLFVVKDNRRAFYFRYISVFRNTLLVVSDDGEELAYRLENQFEVKAARNFCRNWCKS